MSVMAFDQSTKRMAKLTVRSNIAAQPSSDAAIRQTIRWGSKAGLIGLAVALVWGALVPIGGAVVADGQVTVRGERKAVQHLEGGVVDKVFVEDGERVTEGQQLVQLNSIHSQSAVAQLRHQIVEMSIREARLAAEMAGDRSFDLRPAVLDVIAAGDAGDIERQLLGEMQLQEERAINQRLLVLQAESSVKALQAQVAGVRAELASARKQKSLIEHELKNIRSLYEDGYATLTRVMSYERAATDLEGKAQKSEAVLEERAQQLQQQSLALSRVQADFRRSVLEDVSQTRLALKSLQERLKASLDVQERTLVRSPASGVVTSLQIRGAGQVVEGGATMMEVVPDEERLIVEAKIRPQDIEQIEVGSSAQLQFGAYRSLRRDLVAAKVEYVSADAISDARNGERFYVLRLAVDPEIAARRLDFALQPGMSATAYIETEKRTALAYLLSPISNMLLRALRE